MYLKNHGLSSSGNSLENSMFPSEEQVEIRVHFSFTKKFVIGDSCMFFEDTCFLGCSVAAAVYYETIECGSRSGKTLSMKGRERQHISWHSDPTGVTILSVNAGSLPWIRTCTRHSN